MSMDKYTEIIGLNGNVNYCLLNHILEENKDKLRSDTMYLGRIF
jgi:hypothetical protein